MARPLSDEYAPDCKEYLALVPEIDILPALRSQLTETHGFLAGVSESDSSIRHPPYTWSIKQVVGHMTDCERIFGYPR